MPKIRLATLNVRFDGRANDPVPIPDHGAVPPHKHYPWTDPYAECPWAERRSRMVDALLSTGSIDIVGFQEVLHNQLLDLQALLGPTYDHVGVGRDDGKERGEYSPIFWNKDRFELVRWKTVWLSPTPEVPGSVGWDASQTRIATILTLEFTSPTQSGELVHVVNTHFDDAGKRARGESSLIIREQIKRWAERFEDPDDPRRPRPSAVIVLGDFNSPASEDGYKNMTSSLPVPSGAPSFAFVDSYHHLQSRRSSDHHAVRQSSMYGPMNTYTGFTRPGKTSTNRIDFIMLATRADPRSAITSDHADKSDGEDDGLRGGWEITRYACVDNWIEEADADGWTGRWSDHRAVRVTLERD